MEWIKTDAGRSKYYKATDVGDCGCRALTIATQSDYKETYNKIKTIIGYYPRNGIYYSDFDILMEEFGYEMHECGFKESTTRLDADEIQKGTVVCRINHHYLTMIDGCVYDSWNSTKTKKGVPPMVERYWTKAVC